jgi:hypothetical protein
MVVFESKDDQKAAYLCQQFQLPVHFITHNMAKRITLASCTHDIGMVIV